MPRSMADVPAAQHLARSRQSTWQRAARVLRKDRYLYLIFLLPFLYFLVFHYLPIYGVIIAFKNYKVALGIWGSKWVGLQYFIEFLTDPYAWKLIRNTMLLSLYSIVFGFPMPIILALLLNEIRVSSFKRVVQTVSYLPHFISVVVVAGDDRAVLVQRRPGEPHHRGAGRRFVPVADAAALVSVHLRHLRRLAARRLELDHLPGRPVGDRPGNCTRPPPSTAPAGSRRCATSPCRASPLPSPSC